MVFQISTDVGAQEAADGLGADTATATETRIPPIDRSPPKEIETATFAMG